MFKRNTKENICDGDSKQKQKPTKLESTVVRMVRIVAS